MSSSEGLRLIQVAIAVVVKRGQILICRRRSSDSFGGYWEFPGGKVEPGESPADCVRREVLEELDIEITPLRELATVEHAYSKARVRLHPFICRHDSGEPIAISAAEFVWVAAAALPMYRFPDANAVLIEALASNGFIAGAIDFAGDTP